MILTTEILAKYLGNPADDLLADEPFRDWIFEKSFESDLKELRIDYVFPHNGLDFICDSAGNVRTIFLFFCTKRYFEGGLLDVPSTCSRQEIIAWLGSPSKSGGLVNDPILGEYGPWDRFARFGYSIHVEYQVNADRIRMVTIMRADMESWGHDT